MSVSKVTELFAFSDETFIENVIVRPNGNLLLTSLTVNHVFELDPSAENPQPKPVAELPGCASVTGIARIGPDTYAVSGGTMPRAFLFNKGSMHVYTVSFEAQAAGSDGASAAAAPVVEKVADVPDAEVMNGMTVLPGDAGVILSADSLLGRIFRVDTRTGAVDVAFQDDLLAKSDRQDRVPCGVNGIKVRDGYMYFSNSAKRIFGRIPIAQNGDRTGDTEYFSTIPEDVVARQADDDFDVDESGALWVARHPDSLVKITPGTWAQSVVIGPDSHGVRLYSPTATALDRKRNILYIVSGGARRTGGTVGGQVVKVEMAV